MREDNNGGTMLPDPEVFPAKVLRQICLEAGAYEAGFVEISRPELALERRGILQLYPGTKTIISLSRAMNRENVQSPARPLFNSREYANSK